MNHIGEEELRQPVRDYFEQKRFLVYDEVRLFSRNIDIVAKRGSNLMSVELKMYDWRRAIEQACLNLRVSNYSYIAIPELSAGTINKKAIQESIERGIGLLSVNGVIRKIIRPERSNKIQPILRKQFLMNLRRG